MENIFSFFLLLFGVLAFSQSKINFDEIKKNVTDSNSPYYYEKLVEKFRFSPLSVDSLEAEHLYYGKHYSKYKTSDFSSEMADFRKLIQKKSSQKAIEVGEKLLNQDPTNLEVLALILNAYDRNEDQKKMEIAGLQLKTLIENAIIKNSYGSDDDKTFTVMSVADEYALAALLNVNLQNFQRSSKMNKEGVADVWSNKKNKITFNVVYDLERFK